MKGVLTAHQARITSNPTARTQVLRNMNGAGPLTTVKSAAELPALPNNKTGECEEQCAAREGWLIAGSTAAAAAAARSALAARSA